MDVVQGEPLVAVCVRLTDVQKRQIRDSVAHGNGTTLVIESAAGGPDTIMMTKKQLSQVGNRNGVRFSAEQLEAICPQIAATLAVSLSEEQKACLANAKRELRGCDLILDTTVAGSDKIPVTRRMMQQIATTPGPVTLFFPFEHIQMISLSGVMNSAWLRPVKPHVERASNAASSAFGGAFGGHAGTRLGESLFGYTGVRIFRG